MSKPGGERDSVKEEKKLKKIFSELKDNDLYVNKSKGADQKTGETFQKQELINTGAHKSGKIL